MPEIIIVADSYKLLAAASATELAAMVNEALANGWQPLGGVSVSISESDDYRYPLYAQSMVKLQRAD